MHTLLPPLSASRHIVKGSCPCRKLRSMAGLISPQDKALPDPSRGLVPPCSGGPAPLPLTPGAFSALGSSPHASPTPSVLTREVRWSGLHRPAPSWCSSCASPAPGRAAGTNVPHSPESTQGPGVHSLVSGARRGEVLSSVDSINGRRISVLARSALAHVVCQPQH